jgi:hypothetical protein
MAAMNMVSAVGFTGGKLSFKKMSAGGRLCTLQENPHFWVLTIKVRPPDGTFPYKHITGPLLKVPCLLVRRLRNEVVSVAEGCCSTSSREFDPNQPPRPLDARRRR